VFLVKNRGNSVDLVVFLVVFVAIFTLLFFTISPDPEFIKIMNWNLLTISVFGSVAIIFAFQRKSVLWFPALTGPDILDSFTTGVFWGLITVLFISFSLMAQKVLVGLFSSINLSELGSIPFSSNVLIIILLQPIVETLLLLVGIIVLSEFLRKASIPFAGLLSVLFIALIFSLFHFSVQAQSFMALNKEFPFEYNIDGFISFIFSAGFPQFVMGLLWGILLLIYKDYLTILIAHIVNNVLALHFSGMAVSDGLIALQLISLALIILFLIALLLYGLKPLFKVEFKNLIGV